MTDNNINIESVKDSLVEHLISTLNRVLSLIWGGDANKIIKAVCDEEVTLYLREEYLSKRMSNKYVAAIPVEILAIFRDNTDVNFTDFTDSFRYICNKGELGISDYTFLPYFRQAQDIAITMFFQSICSNNGNENEITNRHEEYLAEIRRWGEDTPVKLRELQNSNASFDTNKGLLIKIGNQKEKKLKIAIANVNVSGVTNLENSLQGKKPNRKYLRYRALAELLNMAIKENANMLVLPENYVPLEWLSALATKAARENIAIITGVEHIIVGKKVYNYTAVILPFRYFNAIPTSAMFFQLKKHYSPGESRIIDGYGYSPICGTEKRPIYQWYDCYFPVYCCFELAAIYDRAEFISWADMIIAVEFNKDTNYFGSIVESLTRDLHCYCVQVNTSEYGDSRITQPTKREMQNLLTVKGGLNQALLVGEVDIQSLREFQIKKYELQKNGFYKPTPPGMDVNIVLNKIAQSFNSDIVI